MCRARASSHPRFHDGAGARRARPRAGRDGVVALIAQLLHDDAVLYTDGGGKRSAALRPIYGKDKILRFIAGVSTKGPIPRPDQIERAPINGLPGVIVRTEQGVETMAIDVRDGKIAAIYIVRNPDKLRHLS